MGKVREKLWDGTEKPERTAERNRAEDELDKRIGILEQTFREMQRRGFYDDIRKQEGDKSPF